MKTDSNNSPDSNPVVTKMTTLDNGLPNCITCRYWQKTPERGNDSGLCLGSTPTIGGNGWGVWPATKATNGCGAWRNSVVSQVGCRAEAKVSTASILKFLHENCDAEGEILARAMTRRDFLSLMVSDFNLSPTAALSRLKSMARRGLIGMGTEPPEAYPIPKPLLGHNLIMVWPIKDAAQVASDESATNEDRLLQCLRKIVPAGSHGMGVREIWRKASELGLSLGTVHRLLGVLFAKGQIERIGKDWRCSGTQAEDVDA